VVSGGNSLKFAYLDGDWLRQQAAKQLATSPNGDRTLITAGRKVLVIAATNLIEKIDPAVRRPGRFDKLVYIPPPDSEARLAMLQFHLLRRPIEPNLDIRGIAAVLDGYSASDIRMLVEESAHAACEIAAPISTPILLDALRRVPPSITQDDEARFLKFRSRGSSQVRSQKTQMDVSP